MRRAWVIAAIVSATTGCAKERRSVVADRGYYAELADETVEIAPYGFTARVPSTWRCKAFGNDTFTSCVGDGWRISWIVEPETRPEPPDVLEPPEPSRDEQYVMESLRERAEVAGFRGVIHQQNFNRIPVCNLDFDGWRDVAGARLHLAIEAQRWHEPEHVERPLAAILTTTDRDGGGASTFRPPPWPEASRLGLTEMGRDGLLDESATEDRWRSAFWYLDAARITRDDGVVPLVASRAAHLARGDYDDVYTAYVFVDGLARWDRSLARARLDDLDAAIAARTSGREIDGDAKRWTALGVKLAALRAQIGMEP